jgi:hypothetical protein
MWTPAKLKAAAPNFETRSEPTLEVCLNWTCGWHDFKRNIFPKEFLTFWANFSIFFFLRTLFAAEKSGAKSHKKNRKSNEPVCCTSNHQMQEITSEIIQILRVQDIWLCGCTRFREHKPNEIKYVQYTWPLIETGRDWSLMKYKNPGHTRSTSARMTSADGWNDGPVSERKDRAPSLWYATSIFPA